MKPKEQQPEKWILPAVTRAILAEWEAAGLPDIWPYPLFDSARGEWVDIGSVEELQAATLESEPGLLP